MDLIKVDVEGAELEVLRGSKGVIDKIDSWIIELHTSVVTRDQLEGTLKDFGYRTSWIDPTHIFAKR